MNISTIQFKSSTATNDTGSHKVVDILINGTNIIELLRKYEKQFDNKMAGQYNGLTADILYRNLTENIAWTTPKINILACNGCGEEGCWPMLITVKEIDEHVTWSDFEQPRRGKNSKGEFWDYSNFGSFSFGTKVYTKQLENLKLLIDN